VTRCGAVTPRERGESNPVVTVLVTRLSRHSNQELGGSSFALAAPCGNPISLVIAGYGASEDRGSSPAGT
jgi:hypothetical protein